MGQVSNQLTYLESADLLRLAQTQPELAYLFRHALVQEAAYTVLLQADRKRLHQQAGESLERLYPDRLDELAAQLGRHFALAGDYPRALHYLTLAGDAAMRVYANIEAVAYYTFALDTAGKQADSSQLTHLYNRRGRALELNSQYAAALANYEQMEQAALSHANRPMELAAVMGQATIHTTANPVTDTTAGQSLLAKALHLAQELEDQATQARILWNLMLLNVLTGGDPVERLQHGEAALHLAQQLQLQELTAFIHHDLWYTYGAVGQYEKVVNSLAEAAALWRQLGNMGMLAATLCRRYLTALAVGQLQPAIAYSQEAFQLAQASNDLESLALSRFHVGWAYLHLGRPAEAINAMQEALAIGEPIHNITVLTCSRADLGYFYGLFGRIQPGIQLAQAAAHMAETEFPFILPWVLPTLSRLYLLQGDPDQATATLARAGSYQLVKQQVSFFPISWITFGLAEIELALAQQAYDLAVTLADRLITDMQTGSLHLALAEAFHLKSKALLVLGRRQESYLTLQAGRQEAEAIGSRWALWPILIALAELEVEQGNPSEAKLLRQAAEEIIISIASHISPAELRAAFLQQSQIQQLIG